MELMINDKNEIVGYNFLSTGGLQIDQGNVPDELLSNFISRKWRYANNQILINPDYKTPAQPIRIPTAAETKVAALAYQQMTTQQTITDLQAQNAQMAYQLMTVQGGATA